MAKILLPIGARGLCGSPRHGRQRARIFLPPYAEPMRPLADPILWRETELVRAHMAYKEEEAQSVRRHQQRHLLRMGHFGFTGLPFHNIAGMLYRTAPHAWPRPQFVHPDECAATPAIFPL